MEDMRKVKGMSIAKEHTIKQVEGGWIVPSQNSNKNYFVGEHDFDCTCPDCRTRKLTCKHAYAVKYFLGFEKADGSTQKVRLTYKQAWHTYNQAQTSEIKQFEILLTNLLESIEEPIISGAGRKPVPTREAFFCAIKKVYSQMSSRRAKGLFDEAKEKSLIAKSPYFNCVSVLLNKENTTELLEKLITLSALPLKSVEHTWLADSSGFRTTQFNQYCQEKHGASKQHKWLKAHIVCGAKTNIISSAKVTASDGIGSGDCPNFAPLMQTTKDAGFEVTTAIADKAYSSRDNLSLIDYFGGTALIPFKSNAIGKPRGKSHIWRKMFNYFQLNQEEFYDRYHARSNVETTFHMIKSKLGDSLKSKNFTAQRNELLCKIVAHNIIILITEMYELGIAPQFEPFFENKESENLHVNKETCTLIQQK